MNKWMGVEDTKRWKRKRIGLVGRERELLNLQMSEA
jgi:hypothetical protein